MESALLVGGSGFIGRGLRAALEARGVRVTSVDRSVRDVRERLDEELPEVDAVVHLAQSPNYRDFPGSARELFETNLASLNEYCRAAIGRAKLVVFFSSGSIFGRQEHAVTPETPPNPSGFYSFTKHAGELCLAEYREHFSTLVLRPFNPYGPGQVDKLLPNLAARILAGEPLKLTAGMRLAFLYLDDLVDLTIGAMERVLTEGDHRVFNQGSDEVVTLEEAARELGRALGREPEIELDSSGGETVVAADCRDLYDYARCEPRVPLAEGLRRTVQTVPGRN